MKRLSGKLILLCFITTSLSCSLAPKNPIPRLEMPVDYKEQQAWLNTQAISAAQMDGQWWTMFGDPCLNELEEQVTFDNQNLQAALARYEIARGALTVAESGLYPSFIGVAQANRQKVSGNVANPSPNLRYNDRLIGTNFSYEVDLWGQVRNSVRASKNLAWASAADLSALDLSLHAQLATTYFALRGQEITQKLLDEIVVAYQKAYVLVRNRYQGGAAPVSDADQALLQLENAQTLATETRLKRAQLEHAIAVLIGRAAGNFTLPVSHHVVTLPVIRPDLPSTLLLRRPDIAAARRRVEAANAQIGVARAAFFPLVNLVGDIGLESASFKNLLSSHSLFWALGPSIVGPLFDGGLNEGLLQEATAFYYETVANYRQTVLAAFQDVEDNLAAQRELAVEDISQTAATKAAQRVLQQANYRYKGGIVTYLEVVVDQNAALQAELASIDLLTRRQFAAITLVKALGGGWCEYANI